MKITLPLTMTLTVAALLAAGGPPADAAVHAPSAAPVQYGRTTAGLQIVPGHLRPSIAAAPVVGTLPLSQTLHLSIGLPLRNRSQEQALAATLSNRKNRHSTGYLTPAQFAATFGPSPSDYQAVINFARVSHFAVTRTFSNRVVVDADATVAAVQQAFHLIMQRRLRPDGSMFYAPSNEPALALSTPVLHIAGLDNERIAAPQLNSVVPVALERPNSGHGAGPAIGSGPFGTYAGPDFRDAYAPTATQTGLAQCLGLFELDSTFFPSDISSYQSMFGLPALSPQVVLLDGYNGIPVVSHGEEETALDIEVGQAMAPGLSNIIVNEGTNPDDILSAMVAPSGVPRCNQLSASWTYDVDATSQELTEEMAAQGQSFFDASGDAGGWTSDTNDDRDLSDITVVGGTVLTTNADHRWVSEVAWPHSGGGIESSQYVPPFQYGLQIYDLGGGSSSFRMDPDVAMVAANTYLVANDGGGYTATGTSISTPLWAAFTALVNQKALSVGDPRVGYANPALYSIGENSAAYPLNFHDITSGNNGVYSASPGYDLVTGWGSPQGKLISTLNPPPTIYYTQLQILVYTGSDDLRPDSDLAVSFTGVKNLSPFCLMRSNNGSPSGVCTGNVYGDINGTQGWSGWSTQVLTYTNRFDNWQWAGTGKMTLTMTSHNNGFETNDNWDIQAMRVILSNPSTGAAVTLFNVGNFAAPHNSGTCYWRFKTTGSPPMISVIFNLLPGHTPSDGCPDD